MLRYYVMFNLPAKLTELAIKSVLFINFIRMLKENYDSTKTRREQGTTHLTDDIYSECLQSLQYCLCQSFVTCKNMCYTEE